MTTPLERVQSDVKDAMRAQDKARLGTLRLLLTAIKNEQIARGAELDDEALFTVVKRAVKQRRDAADQYRHGGREELAALEEAEIVILDEYLPAQVTPEEVRAAVEAHVAAEGVSGIAAMGGVMKAMMATFGATVDGKTLSTIVREVLTS